MVHKVALGQVYLRVLWFTPVIIIRVHINAPYSPSKINLIKRAGIPEKLKKKKKVGSTKQETLSLLLLFMPLPKGQAGIAW